MNLEKFKQKNPKKIGISIFTVVCILLIAGIFFYTSFASFETKQDFNIIEGSVESNGDLYFVFYVDGVISKSMPQKGDGYVIDTEKTNCTKGASVEFNETEWSVKVTNMTETRTKCTLYFEKTAAQYVKDLEAENTSLVYDGTTDNNLRYVGEEPDNYVSFNDELWRIIGVMNNIDDGTGKKESRIKIINSELISEEEYSWDNKASGTGSSDSNSGSNDWSDSTLQIVLNEGAYWNRTSGSCPIGPSGGIITVGGGFTTCDFSSTGLTEEAKVMIGDALWNLGGSSTYEDVTTSMFYESERGSEVYSGHATEWIGKVGLMYPSDYGYATNGGSTIDRETCLNTALYNWGSISDCKNNNWLYYSLGWSISPSSANSSEVFFIQNYGLWTNGTIGRVIVDTVTERHNIHPVVYS